MKCISIDIGSTYTKGALFDLNNYNDAVIKKHTTATTLNNLSDCFFDTLYELRDGKLSNIPLYFSSSAHGGLAIVSLGIVPDLTAKAAFLAAASAGGKIIKNYAYKLSKSDISEIALKNPDIILFTGGTDGGNEEFNLHNARILADSKISAVILYAGNKYLRDAISEILSEKNVVITENVMPEINVLNLEPARKKIREIFLSNIVNGKGLEKIIKETGSEPCPTPLALYELVKSIPEVLTSWDNSLFCDIGGATTDCYSNSKIKNENESIILRGIKEPEIKRTVEGDLGIRINAEHIANNLKEKDMPRWIVDCTEKPFLDYIRKISNQTDCLPSNNNEKTYDYCLARYCYINSIVRHAGIIKEIYTPQGKQYIQNGKDLRLIGKIVGTGGYLAQCLDPSFFQIDDSTFQSFAEYSEGTLLLPQKVSIFIDQYYLLPLLGNIVRDFPEAASNIAVNNLKKIN